MRPFPCPSSRAIGCRGGQSATDRCRLPPGRDFDWSIATRPRRAEAGVDQTLVATFGRDEGEVRLNAQLAAANAHLFQYRLKVPPTLAVEQVSVLDGGLQRVARWTQDAQGTVSVFLTGPLAGPHTLELIAHQPIAMDKELPLPTFEWEDCHVRSAGVQIWRRPEILVEMGRISGLQEDQEPPAGRREAGAPRPVGAWHGTDLATPPGTLPCALIGPPCRPRKLPVWQAMPMVAGRRPFNTACTPAAGCWTNCGSTPAPHGTTHGKSFRREV